MPCKVEGCRYYGKPMYFLAQHMKQHEKFDQDMKIHKRCTLQGAKKGKKADKSRKAEKCMHPDCNGVIYTRLTRHIWRMHKMSRFQYNDLLQM